MTSSPIELVPAEGGSLTLLIARLRRALAGEAPFAPYAAGPSPEWVTSAAGSDHDPGMLPAGLALVISTSGSTGTPKWAMLTADALLQSAEATQTFLGGPGRWVLAVPTRHIAGLQVLTRAIVAGTDVVEVDRRGGFRPGPFAAAVRQAAMGDAPVYVSLVPTQVSRLLRDAQGCAALARCAAVLVGGAALPPRVRDHAATAGVRLVTTYGMSETAGGCVYDGRPLPGTRIRLDDGRISLGGATVAHGYLGQPELTAEVFGADPDGTRWFVTDDIGAWETSDGDVDDRLRVLGRRDDVLVTGGMKVAPRVVEEAVLAAFPQVLEVLAVGLPDPEWGQCVALGLVYAAGTSPLTVAELRDGLRDVLAAYALPRKVVSLAALPERGPGKPDRAALARRLAKS